MPPPAMGLAILSLHCVVGEVNHEEVTVSATPGHGSNEEEEITYTDVKVIGKGTFGIVCRAKLSDTGELVAIKKVFHDERFKVCEHLSASTDWLAYCVKVCEHLGVSTDWLAL